MGQTAYQVVQEFGHQQCFSKSSKSYKTSQLFESSLLSGEFRFFGPSVHVSSPLRLCGNASCELSQGKLLGMEKNWRLAMFVKSPWNAPNIFFDWWIINFWWKWFQTLFCVSIFVDHLSIWYGPNSYYLGGCLYIEEQRLEWLRYSMFKVFLLNTIRRQGVFVFWHRESQILPLSLLRANQQIQNYPQFIQGRRPDHVWFLQNHHACYILHFLRILQYR